MARAAVVGNVSCREAQEKGPRHVRGGRVVECGCTVEVLHPGGQRGGGGLRSGGSAVPTKEAPVCAGAEDCEVGFAGVPDLQAYNLNSRCRVLVP
jgi:hypothetical protein